MTTAADSLQIVPESPPSALELRAADQGVADALESVLSDNTRRVYAAQWKLSDEWCDSVCKGRRENVPRGRLDKVIAKAAGLADWEFFSGHSGRVGMARRMAQNGAPTHEIERQGRWKRAAAWSAATPVANPPGRRCVTCSGRFLHRQYSAYSALDGASNDCKSKAALSRSQYQMLPKL